MSDKKGANPLASGIAGAVIGAAAAAAAIVLSDEKNRKKAEKALGEMQKEGTKVLEEITKIAMDLKDRGTQVVGQVKAKKLTGPKVATKSKTKVKAKKPSKS